MSLPIVAVADLHGHPAHLDHLVRLLDDDLGDYTLVTLGDYCDNGPDVPGLLDRLIALHLARPGRVVSIMGNHDLACLRSMGWPGEVPDPDWCGLWQRNYWNHGQGTPSSYGAASAAALAGRMPATHRAFLQELPWFHDTDGYLFVHAGMKRGPLEPQRQALAARRLPPGHLHLPPQLRDKTLAHVADPTWDRIVVSAHHKHRGAPLFVGPNRISLSSEVDTTGRLLALTLPEEQLIAVDRSSRITRRTV